MQLQEEIDEARVQYRLNQDMKRNRICITSEDMISSCDPDEIRDITVDSSFDGDIEKLRIYKKVESLIIYPTIHWTDLLKIRLEGIHSLSIRVPKYEKPEIIRDYSLKSLTITFIGDVDDAHYERYTIDFSGMPYLESVSLLDAEQIDLKSLCLLKRIKYFQITSDTKIRSAIPVLDSLETLYICGIIDDFSFLEDYYLLKKLVLSHTTLSDLNILWNMESLEYLDISNDDNMDISPLVKLKKLKEVNIHYHPVFNDLELRKNKDLKLLLTNEDRDRNSILTDNPFNFFRYVSSIEKYKTKVQNSNETYAYRKKHIIENDIDQVKKMMQMDFEKQFWFINPWGIPLSKYKFEYKKLYLEKCSVICTLGR